MFFDKSESVTNVTVVMVKQTIYFTSMEHKYSLEKYKGTASRHVCPKCERKGKFALYIDNDTGMPLNDKVGRCERQDNCGYHYTPSEWFKDNPTECVRLTYAPTRPTPPPQPPKEIGRIPREYLINSLGYNSNFVAFLCSLFDRYTLESPSIESMMENYYLGQGKNKEVIYWQIDGNRRIRTGKIMQYDPKTGKRVKDANGAINWVHSTLKRKEVLPSDFNLTQCLFGEHLLNRRTDAPVAIVESEKSALIASVMMPDYIWVATGGKQNFKPSMCQILKGRKVVAYPDLGGYAEWETKAKEMETVVGCKIAVSDLLERVAPDEDRTKGYDIADYMIKQLRDAIPIETITKPFTNEEKALQHFVSINPNVLTLIDKLDLVSAATGEKLRVN